MSDQSERDWSEHLHIQLVAEVEKVNKLQDQLAAEREKHESCVAWEDHNETLDELQNCKEQLAAERELLRQQIEATAAARLRASEAEQQLQPAGTADSVCGIE
jgi:peptidoglycan hydrolase CwlO-like protein